VEHSLPLEIPDWMERTVQLLGEEKVRMLNGSHVLVAGLGGVGSMAAEMLVRSGIGTITLVDSDVVQASNLNRQIPALQSTIGRPKVEVMTDRLKDINPDVRIVPQKMYLDEKSIERLFAPAMKDDKAPSEDHTGNFDFVVDAIDTLTPKILFIERVVKLGLPLASSMGSGGKTDVSKIKIDDFGNSFNCRLAYLLRKKLRKLGVERGFRVVFSTELTDKEKLVITEGEPNKKSTTGTVAYIPAIFGCMLASIVMEELTKSG